ncbi:hypothetical protein ACTJJ8_10160 [Agrobacterium radiobacter]|uniref:hypothetical protein n=1 Tax=Agrobacterium radiobacter TaxID=362 RepID=UPI003F8354BF
MAELQYRPNHYDDWGMIRNADGSMHASVHRPETYGGEFDECREEGTDPLADLARKIIFYDDLEAENASLRQLLSEAEKREREARAKAVEDVLSALTAHELYQYRPKAFQGFIEYARSTVANSEESQLTLACAAYDLAAWAGSINWRGGENQKEWLDELRQHIATVQSLCKPYRSAIRALQSEER